ncbi:MAG TPA: methyltransferase [Luteimonas sp.]|nr:methyltransferase [Luteimonas sp.]
MHLHKGSLALAVAGLVAAAAAVAAQQVPAVPDYVGKAVADPARGDNAKDDARRHVAELVAFSGAKPGDKVVELIPSGTGYFTQVFSKVVGDGGKVYAIWPTEYDKEAGTDSADVRKLAQRPGFGNIEVLVQPAAAFSTPGPVDVVFTSQNYHDYPDKFMGPTDPALLDKAVFAALKPGGTFVVIDHVAEAGSGLRDTGTLHRIDPEFVKKQVMAAGFEYAGESGVLRNPKDDHTLKVFDKAIRGHTDQFAYKFRKPM